MIIVEFIKFSIIFVFFGMFHAFIIDKIIILDFDQHSLNESRITKLLCYPNHAQIPKHAIRKC